ncbi:hypothetical protein [Microbacterium deminutum]|uniref:Uncharacterized protein n=1 Tax=Microbacterium deminutum TaxID=344164 RepID=A0ABP5CF33_9MICO
MSTDQPQQPGPAQPVQPAPTAYIVPPPSAAAAPGYPVYSGAAPSPAPPARGSSSHIGVIVAAIIGGLVLLGLAFGAGGVVGWVIGSHNAGREIAQVHIWQGPDGFGQQQGGGQGRGKHDGREQQIPPEEPGQEQPTPVPTPAPTTP